MSERRDQQSPTDRNRPEARFSINRRHPIGGEMSDVVLGLLRRFRLTELVQYHNSTVVLALFSLINGFISIAIMAAVALVTHAPFIFPSLGPTAFLLFYTPTAPVASPRNTIAGHLIGALAGWLSLVIFGLTATAPAFMVGVDWPRVGAAALSLGATSFFMVLFKVPHPPAGATTLIISLGILRQPYELIILMIAVAMLNLQAYVINHLAGIDYPRWAPHETKP